MIFDAPTPLVIERPRGEARWRTSRAAVACVFGVNGVAGASWYARIPAIQSRLDLSSGQLGLALLGAAAGALLTMTLAGWLITRAGSKRVVTVATLLYCAFITLPAFAPSLPLLFAGIFVWGAVNGAMDVAMNAQAAHVEARYGRPIMASFHGVYSVGAMLGAGSSGIVAGLGVDPRPHLVAVGLLAGTAAIVVTRTIAPAPEDHIAAGPAFARPSPALLTLGAIAMFAFVGEGAMADWSAVYLRRVLDTGPGLAATGYAAFSLAMAASRFASDRLTHRLGPVVLVRGGGLLAAGGMGLALLAPFPALALVGFALVGAGFSTIAPLTFGAAARTPGVPPGPGIAAVTSMGYLGFLAGPPVIGGVASATTLRGALSLVVALSLGIVVLSGSVKRQEA